MGVMGIHNSWTQQHQRKKRSKSHRHRAQYINLIAAPAGAEPSEFSATSLGAQINHRVDGRQSDQTGEAKILVIHTCNARAPQIATLPLRRIVPKA